MMEKPELGAASVLNQWENEGRNLTKWELCRVVKELRKFKRYNLALEILFRVNPPYLLTVLVNIPVGI